VLLAQSRPAARSQPQLGTAIIIAIMATITITTIIATTPIILATIITVTGIGTKRQRSLRSPRRAAFFFHMIDPTRLILGSAIGPTQQKEIALGH
jgi:hypothetical protein